MGEKARVGFCIVHISWKVSKKPLEQRITDVALYSSEWRLRP